MRHDSFTYTVLFLRRRRWNWTAPTIIRNPALATNATTSSSILNNDWHVINIINMRYERRSAWSRRRCALHSRGILWKVLGWFWCFQFSAEVIAHCPEIVVLLQFFSTAWDGAYSRPPNSVPHVFVNFLAIWGRIALPFRDRLGPSFHHLLIGLDVLYNAVRVS